MPIEIYELVVKATVAEPKKPEPDKDKSSGDCDCKEAAVAQVLEILHRKKER